MSSISDDGEMRMAWACMRNRRRDERGEETRNDGGTSIAIVVSRHHAKGMLILHSSVLLSIVLGFSRLMLRC